MAKNLELKLEKIESLTGFKADICLTNDGFVVGLFELEVNDYRLVESVHTDKFNRVEAAEEVIEIVKAR